MTMWNLSAVAELDIGANGTCSIVCSYILFGCSEPITYDVVAICFQRVNIGVCWVMLLSTLLQVMISFLMYMVPSSP